VSGDAVADGAVDGESRLSRDPFNHLVEGPNMLLQNWNPASHSQRYLIASPAKNMPRIKSEKGPTSIVKLKVIE